MTDFAKAFEEAAKRFSVATQALSIETQGGVHASRKKGLSGFEIVHFQDYDFDKDPRSIDWKITARVPEDKIIIRELEQERIIPVVLSIDMSNSVRWRSGKGEKSKGDVVFDLSTGIALSVLGQGDSVGAFIFSDTKPLWFYPERTEENVREILEEVYKIRHDFSMQADKSEKQEAFFKQVARLFQGPGLVFIISDFLFPPDNIKKNLRKLASFDNDVVVLVIRESLEMEFPELGNGEFVFRDVESDREVLLDSKNIEQLRAIQEENISQLKSAFRGIDHLFLRTDDDYLKKFLTFLFKREK